MDARKAKHSYMGQVNPDGDPTTAIVNLFDLVIELQAHVIELSADRSLRFRALDKMFDDWTCEVTLNAETLRAEYIFAPMSSDADFITIIKLLTIVAALQERLIALELQQQNMIRAMEIMWGEQSEHPEMDRLERDCAGANS
jgi:hypothetical protein